jgi:hypothetical protein
MISATTRDLSEGADSYQPGIVAGVFIPTHKPAEQREI